MNMVIADKLWYWLKKRKPCCIDQEFDFVKSGGSVVYIEGTQVIISKIFSCSFPED